VRPSSTRAHRLALVVALAALAVVSTVAAGVSAAPEKRRPATHRVIIEGAQFMPAALAVAAGDRVVWVNKDLFPHTVTAAAGGFNSGDIQAGASWTYVVVKKGDYGYTCSYHPTMKAVLRVQ
jgi:plastocyanin